jgi:acyl-[acyl-carrier-protein]-phospholipid O-acyltransferase/long-chain-fatty-acid--[acyl-carrier-protein] ligase
LTAGNIADSLRRNHSWNEGRDVLGFLSWLATKLIYRLRIRGQAHVPLDGPALIVCNHVSYIDGVLLMAASPRKLRFVIDAHFVNARNFLGWFLRTIGAVAMPRSGPKAQQEALKHITELLQQGHLLAAFPEGYPTRCGTMLPFRRGLERLVEKTGCPVIPASIDRMWGSFWSYYGGKLFGKFRCRERGPVMVRFGPALQSPISAADARQAVQSLLAESAKERAKTIRPVHRTFVRLAAKHPFRPCLIDTSGSGRRLNYAKTFVAAAAMAKLLRPKLGATPMVGIWLPSSTGGVLANLAMCLLGKTAVNLNYTAGADAVQSAVRQCQIRHVLTSKRFIAKMPFEAMDGVQLIPLEEIVPLVGKWAKLSNFLKVLLLPGWMLELVMGLGGHTADDLATVVFSSGSTGEPKGIMLTHGNIAANADAFHSHAEFNYKDRVLGVLPFFHSFGYTVTMWGPLTIGASALYLPDPRAAKEVGEWAKKEQCTVTAATATFMRFYLRRCDGDDFRSMRLMVCGAEKLPIALADEFEKKFGIRPLEGYGCTELSPVVSVNMPDVTTAKLTQIRNKNGTVGHPLPGIACQVVHPETKERLPIDAEGLLLVTGPNVMRGYLGKEEMTRQAMHDGWYITGDIGRLDADGFITLTGRQSRFAKVGGEMVPLERLEDELHAVANCNDRLFAVTSLPDEKKGERIVVLHLPLPDGMICKTLCDALSDRGLPNLWVPGERDFFAVEQMPILGSGKLDLQKLKQVAQEIVGQ